MTFLFFILLFHLEDEDTIIKTKNLSNYYVCMYIYAFLYEKSQEKQSNVDHVNVILLSFLPS